MKLQKILNRLEKKHPKKIDLSLNRTFNLLKKLGNPQDKLKNVICASNIKQALVNADLVIIHTEWNDFKSLNFKSLTKKKNFIVYDMRNLYSPNKMKKNNIKYFGVGR